MGNPRQGRSSKAGDADDLRLPFQPGEVSNGEFIPRPISARDRLITGLAFDRAVAAADRAGIDRRRFLQSAGGMAAVLGVVNLVGCSASETATPATSTATTSTDPGGEFDVPDPVDVDACEAALGGNGEFIFDVHSHHVMPDGEWRQAAPAIASMIADIVPVDCVEPDAFDCLDRVSYIQDMFLASDTTVALLSDVPNGGTIDAPLPFDDKVATREFAESLTLGGLPRVLVHDVLAPNFGPIEGNLELMTAHVEGGQVTAFKAYPAWGPGGQGYSLADPQLGLPVIEHARDLGVKVFAAHKGLPLIGFDERFNGPEDLVAAAALYPDMDFVVFHSAFERETVEGPYDPADASRGVNSLVKAMDDRGLPPNGNLWAELGTTWRETMSDPTQAAHVLGKLLSRVGEERVLWGTDAIWFGSPQPQIMAFRAFQITEAFQAQFGYPALTDELKARVLGLNAAELFDFDLSAGTDGWCAIDAAKLDEARAAFSGLVAEGAVAHPWQPRGPLTRRQVLTWLRDRGEPFTPW